MKLSERLGGAVRVVGLVATLGMSGCGLAVQELAMHNPNLTEKQLDSFMRLGNTMDQYVAGAGDPQVINYSGERLNNEYKDTLITSRRFIGNTNEFMNPREFSEITANFSEKDDIWLGVMVAGPFKAGTKVEYMVYKADGVYTKKNQVGDLMDHTYVVERDCLAVSRCFNIAALRNILIVPNGEYRIVVNVNDEHRLINNFTIGD